MIFSVLAILLAFTVHSQRKIKEIESTKPKYIARSGKAWEKSSRIIGEVRKAPAQFTIEVHRSGLIEATLSESHPSYLSTYETAMIPPGKYNIIFIADGYVNHIVKGVTIKPATDCVIDIVFGTKEYIR